MCNVDAEGIVVASVVDEDDKARDIVYLGIHLLYYFTYTLFSISPYCHLYIEEGIQA